MNILSVTVKPNIPERLKPLEEMAYNLWVSWNFDAIMLFMRLDYDLWISSRQNPARVLGAVSQERLEEMVRDDSFLAALEPSTSSSASTWPGRAGTRGGAAMRSPTSPWSTAWTCTCPSTPAAWGCCPATT